MILPDGQGHLKSSTPLILCWVFDLSLARTHRPLAYLGLALSISTRQFCGWFSIHISCFSYLPCWGTLLCVYEIDWDTNSENPGRKTLFLFNKVLVPGSSQPYKENNSYTNLDNCFCLPNVSGQRSSGACELPHGGSLCASLKPQKSVKMATEGSAKSAQASLWQVLAHSSGSSSKGSGRAPGGGLAWSVMATRLLLMTLPPWLQVTLDPSDQASRPRTGLCLFPGCQDLIWLQSCDISVTLLSLRFLQEWLAPQSLLQMQKETRGRYQCAG